MQIKTKITSLLPEYYHDKNEKQLSIVKDVEKRETLCILAGKVSWCSLYLKQHEDSPK